MREREQRVQNTESPYYGKLYHELPPLPPLPARVVRNRESKYYGLTLKKSERLHRKLYPHPPPPPESEGCYMYRVEYRKVKGSERIKKPVEWAKRTVENLAKWLCKQGVFKPASKRTRPRGPYRFVAIGKRWYSVRLPGKPPETFMVDTLLELDQRVIHFAQCYRKNEHEKAIWDAFEIGTTSAIIEAAQYDRDVKYGRPGLQQLAKHRETASKIQRENRQPLWQKIIAAQERRLTWGQIEKKTGASRSTIARALRRHRRAVGKK